MIISTLKMFQNENTSLKSNILIFLIIIFCILIGKAITVIHFTIPVIVLMGALTFILAFTHVNIAMMLLIFSMLLSPEIILGAVSSRRDIVVRIDDLLILTFSLAWFARTAINPKLQFIRRTPINRFIGFYIVVFIFCTLKGMITSERMNIFTGTFYILKYFEYFLIFYLAAGITHEKKQVKMFLKAFIITFLIVNIYAFVQIGAKGRVSAPFEGKIGEPNTLGGYQVLLIAVIIGLAIHMNKSKWKFPLVGLALFSFIPFVHTLSRASYLSIIFMYLTLIFYTRTRAKNTLIGVLIIVVILSFFFFPKTVKNRVMNTFIAEEQESIPPVEILGVTLSPSASARINDWTRNFRDWKRRPFFGYGITAKGFLDSQYIRTLVELGMVGFISFLLLIISIFRQVLRIYLNAKDDMLKGLALGFLAGHVGMLVHSLTANTFIIIRIMEPYWFLAAMVLVIPYIENPKEEIENAANKKISKRYNLTRLLTYEQKHHLKV